MAKQIIEWDERPDLPKECIFCGSKDLSKTHIYPDWLRRKIIQNLPKHKDSTIRTFRFIGKEQVAEKSLERTNNDLWSYKPKLACRNCNHGWMNEPEYRIRELYDCLIEQTSKSFLKSNDFKVTSLWISLIVCLSERARYGGRVIDNDILNHLYINKYPPKEVLIFVGSHVILDWARKWEIHAFDLPLPEIRSKDKKFNSVIATLGIERLFCHFAYTTSINLMKEVHEYCEDYKLQQIWPIPPQFSVIGSGGTPWPKGSKLTAQEVNDISQRVVRELQPL